MEPLKMDDFVKAKHFRVFVFNDDGFIMLIQKNGRLDIPYGQVEDNEDFKAAEQLIITKPLSEKLHVGGKALNFAYALACAGVCSHLSASIGNDALGARLEKECKGLGVLPALSRNAAHTFAFWIDKTLPIVLQDGSALRQPALPPTPSFEAVVAHAVSDESFLLSLAEQIQHKGGSFIFNPAPIENLKSLTPIYQSDLLIANESEAIAISKMAGVKVYSALRLANGLQEKFKKNVVVTLGARGVSAAFGNGCFYQEAFPSTLIDTVGAGDAFLGFFLASHIQGKSISESLQMGVAAGSLVCEVRGAIRTDLSVSLAEEHISRNIQKKQGIRSVPPTLRFGS